MVSVPVNKTTAAELAIIRKVRGMATPKLSPVAIALCSPSRNATIAVLRNAAR
jgi:hypothetical protein